MNRDKPRGADGTFLNDKAAMVVFALKKRGPCGKIIQIERDVEGPDGEMVKAEGVVEGPFKVSKTRGSGVGSYSGVTLGGLFVEGTSARPMKGLNLAWDAEAVEGVVLLADSINPSTGNPVIRCFEGYIIPEAEQKGWVGRRPVGWRAWREILDWDTEDWPWEVPGDVTWMNAMQ